MAIINHFNSWTITENGREYTPTEYAEMQENLAAIQEWANSNEGQRVMRELTVDKIRDHLIDERIKREKKRANQVTRDFWYRWQAQVRGS